MKQPKDAQGLTDTLFPNRTPLERSAMSDFFRHYEQKLLPANGMVIDGRWVYADTRKMLPDENSRSKFKRGISTNPQQPTFHFYTHKEKSQFKEGHVFFDDKLNTLYFGRKENVYKQQYLPYFMCTIPDTTYESRHKTTAAMLATCWSVHNAMKIRGRMFDNEMTRVFKPFQHTLANSRDLYLRRKREALLGNNTTGNMNNVTDVTITDSITTTGNMNNVTEVAINKDKRAIITVMGSIASFLLDQYQYEKLEYVTNELKARVKGLELVTQRVQTELGVQAQQISVLRDKATNADENQLLLADILEYQTEYNQLYDELSSSLRYTGEITSALLEKRTTVEIISPQTLSDIESSLGDQLGASSITPDFNVMKTRLVGFIRNGMQLEIRAPVMDPEAHDVIRIYPLPDLKSGRRPEIESDIVIVNKERTQYFTMTATALERCRRTPCEKPAVVKQSSASECGLAQYLGKSADKCTWTPDSTTHNVYKTSNGALYTTKKSTTVTMDCKQQSNMRAEVQGTGYIPIPPGCVMTIHWPDRPEVVTGPRGVYKVNARNFESKLEKWIKHFDADKIKAVFVDRVKESFAKANVTLYRAKEETIDKPWRIIKRVAIITISVTAFISFVLCYCQCIMCRSYIAVRKPVYALISKMNGDEEETSKKNGSVTKDSKKNDNKPNRPLSYESIDEIGDKTDKSSQPKAPPLPNLSDLPSRSKILIDKSMGAISKTIKAPVKLYERRQQFERKNNLPAQFRIARKLNLDKEAETEPAPIEMVNAISPLESSEDTDEYLRLELNKSPLKSKHRLSGAWNKLLDEIGEFSNTHRNMEPPSKGLANYVNTFSQQLLRNNSSGSTVATEFEFKRGNDKSATTEMSDPYKIEVIETKEHPGLRKAELLHQSIDDNNKAKKIRKKPQLSSANVTEL